MIPQIKKSKKNKKNWKNFNLQKEKSPKAKILEKRKARKTFIRNSPFLITFQTLVPQANMSSFR